MSVCLVFIILPGPSSGAPPRAAVPGSGLAPTPRYNIHPYKESRPPGALIDKARSERHRSSLWTIEVLVPREPRRGGLQPEPDKEGHRNDKNWGIEPHPLHRTTANQSTQKKGERRGLHVGRWRDAVSLSSGWMLEPGMHPSLGKGFTEQGDRTDTLT